MNMKVTFILLSGLLIAACSDSSSSNTSTELDEAQAKSKAAALVNGSAVAATKIDTPEERRWKVEVKVQAATIDIELERKDGSLVEMEAEKGPFDYDFAAPVTGYMTFSQAKAKALANKQGNIEAWEVDVPKTQYEFYVREPATTRLFEIKMNAKTGDTTSVEEKDAKD
jgi:uncharacterized membrane protein YkoI